MLFEINFSDQGHLKIIPPMLCFLASIRVLVHLKTCLKYFFSALFNLFSFFANQKHKKIGLNAAGLCYSDCINELKQTEKMEHLFVIPWMSKSIERRSMFM